MKVKLTPKLAQIIVDRTMKILDRNINIRDKNGIIIASGNPERINTIHEIATKTIEEEKVLRVTEEEAKKMKGVQPGIDLPIYLNNEVVGVVGIIGDPAELDVYAGLVKSMVELMLQQTYYLEQLQLEEQATESFIRELLNNNSNISKKYYDILIKKIGFFEDKFYIVYLLELTNYWEKVVQKLGEPNSIKWQKYKKELKSKINDFFNDIPNVKVFYLEEAKFVIIKNETLKDNSNHLKRCYKLIIEIEKLDFTCKIGIGEKQKGITGIKKSYEMAYKTLNLGKDFYPEEKLYYINNLKLEDLIIKLPLYLQNKLASIFPLEQHYQKTLETYFDNNLNISETSRRLFLHRNSIIYRFNKIFELTGLNPKDFEDAIYLKLALLSYRYKNKK
jgi:carbohydrate diacid regulator